MTNIYGNKDYIWDYRATTLRGDPDYIYYYVHWFRNIFTGIIPIIFLIIVNTAIYYFLSTTGRSRPQYSMSFLRNQDGVSEQYLMEPRNMQSRDVSPCNDIPLENLNTQEMNLSRHPSPRLPRRRTNYSALTLTLIVIMYIICNIPRLVLNLFEHLLQEELTNKKDSCGCKEEPKWFTILCSISHFLLTVNSSANFIIYGVTEKKFKKTAKKLFNSFRNWVLCVKLFLAKMFCKCFF